MALNRVGESIPRSTRPAEIRERLASSGIGRVLESLAIGPPVLDLQKISRVHRVRGTDALVGGRGAELVRLYTPAALVGVVATAVLWVVDDDGLHELVVEGVHSWPEENAFAGGERRDLEGCFEADDEGVGCVLAIGVPVCC